MTAGTERTFTLDVPRMNCADCAMKVTRAAESVPGVRSTRVALATHRLTVIGEAPVEAVIAAVRGAGYEAAPASVSSIRDRIERRRLARAEEERYWKRKCLVAAATLGLVGWMMVREHAHGAGTAALHFWLVTAALVVLAPPFYRNGLPDLVRLRFGMDSMVTLGTLVAYVASVVEMLRGGAVLYFEDAVSVLAFLTIGRYLEARGKDRAMGAVENLVDLAPPLARVLRDGAEVEIPAEAVAPGDRVVVRPGEKVTVDGVVEDGRAEADESLLTGESLPVAKAPGSRVIAGSLLHGGALRILADRTGEETALGEILRELERIDEKRTRYQDFADRVIRWFMPTVLAVAAFTFAGWWLYGGIHAAIRPTVAVLIIACPCALGIAIPIAVSVGGGVAARRGVLIRDPSALDRIPHLGVFVFDKTGSLTLGRLRVAGTLATGIDAAEALRLAAAVEGRSEHPLARAIVEAAAGAREAEVKDFRAEPGAGVEAVADGLPVRVGRLAWCGIVPSPDEARWIEAAAAEGRSVFGATIGGTGAAAAGRILFAVEDTIRPEAGDVIRELARRGYRTVLLSGDIAATVEAVARRLGFDEFRAEILPLEKAAVVRDLRSSGKGVAMLGDGVNDAAAISEADLGIAMKSGAGLSAEAADAVLIRDDLREILVLLEIGDAIRRKARQNLFWAFAYNVLLIPAAAFGVATPMMAAVAMALSDVTVIGNALRLWRASKGAPRSAP